MDKKKKEKLRILLEKGCETLNDEELAGVVGGDLNDERYRVCMDRYRQCMQAQGADKDKCFNDFLSCTGDSGVVRV